MPEQVPWQTPSHWLPFIVPLHPPLQVPEQRPSQLTFTSALARASHSATRPAVKLMSVWQTGGTVRQGVGRLIRDVNDRGVLMVCDPRLLKRTYGQMFLDSVPAMKRSRDIEDVRRFFADDMAKKETT